MKTILIIIGVVILVLVVAGGSFFGGMAYQTNRAEQTRADFFAARGQSGAQQFFPNGQPPGGDQFFQQGEGPQGGQFPGGGGGPAFFGRGGTFGQVKSVEGDVLTLSTAQDVSTVILSGDTQIEKTVSGSVTDLQPGTRVMVIGQEGDDSKIVANRIQIIGDEFSIPLGQPPQGSEP